MILDDGGDATLLVHKGSSASGRRRPRPRQQRLRGVRDRARAAGALAGQDPKRWTPIAEGIRGVTEETTTGVHRLYQMRRPRRAAVPGHQRQRLGDQVEVRQPLRLPSLADRRHQPRHRRDDRRQGRRGVRLRRRRQGLRRGPARPGRPGDRHRDRPDLCAAGGDGGLPGADAWRTWSRRADIFVTATGNRDIITRRPHGADEAQRDRRQHRPLRQRDRHGRAGAARRASSASTSSRRSTSGGSPTATRSSCCPRAGC